MVFYLLVFSKNGKISRIEISNLYNIHTIKLKHISLLNILQVTTSFTKKLRKNNIVLGAISATFFVFLSTVFLGMPQQEAINLTYFLLIAVKEKTFDNVHSIQ